MSHLVSSVGLPKGLKQKGPLSCHTCQMCDEEPWDLHLRQVRDTGILGIDSKPGPEDHSYENNHFIYSVKGLRRTAYVCTFAFA